MMIYYYYYSMRRRILVTMMALIFLSPPSYHHHYFQFFFVGGIPTGCEEKIHENRRHLLSTNNIHNLVINTIDGCESTNYDIWLFAGSGHINLIGEPTSSSTSSSIIDNKTNNNKEGTTAPTSNNNGDQHEEEEEEEEDPKNSKSSDSTTTDKNNNATTASCPTLVFDDGGEKFDKVMYDFSIVFLDEDDDSSSSNGEEQQQDPASSSSTSNNNNQEHHASAWKKDAMRLHKTNHKQHVNNNQTSSSFMLSELTAAYEHAMRRIGDYDIFNNNCATFVLNMMAELGIKVDDSIIKFAASELYKNHTVIEPVLHNQTFMEDLFVEFDNHNDDATTTTSSHHKTTTTGFLRSRSSKHQHHQAQTTTTAAAGGMVVADSLEGTEMFVTHYVKEWSVKYHRMRKTRTPPYMSSSQQNSRIRGTMSPP